MAVRFESIRNMVPIIGLAAFGYAGFVEAACVREMTGLHQCNAKDVSITPVQEIVVVAGSCKNAQDTLTLSIPVAVDVGQKARYDFGVFVPNDGDPNHDGAFSGSCDFGTLPEGAGTDLDGDACGDMGKEQTATFYVTETVSCADASADGKIPLSFCMTWNVNSKASCGGPADLGASNSTQCSCSSNLYYQLPSASSEPSSTASSSPSAGTTQGTTSGATSGATSGTTSGATDTAGSQSSSNAGLTSTSESSTTADTSNSVDSNQTQQGAASNSSSGSSESSTATASNTTDTAGTQGPNTITAVSSTSASTSTSTATSTNASSSAPALAGVSSGCDMLGTGNSHPADGALFAAFGLLLLLMRRRKITL